MPMLAAGTSARDVLISFDSSIGGIWQQDYTVADVCLWQGVSCCLQANVVSGGAAATPLGVTFVYALPQGPRAARSAVRTCSAALNGSIMALGLQGRGLSGSLSAGSLASLRSLEVLDVSDNPGLGGSIPADILQLPNLLLLDGSNTSLSCAPLQPDDSSSSSGSCSVAAGYRLSQQRVPYGQGVVAPAGAAMTCAMYLYRGASSGEAADPWVAGTSLANVPGNSGLLLLEPSYYYFQAGCQCLNGSSREPAYFFTAAGQLPLALCIVTATTANGSTGDSDVDVSVFIGVAVGIGVLALAALLAALAPLWLPAVRRWLCMHGKLDHGSTAGPRGIRGSSMTMPGELVLPPSGVTPVAGSAGTPHAPLTQMSSKLASFTSASKRLTASMGRLMSGGLAGTATRSASRTATAHPNSGSRRLSVDAGKRQHAPGTAPDLFGREVTLVATDVEASTELWEWDPAVMNHALALHDKAVRLSLAACYGYEVMTEGDAFLVAFHEPVDAARWCLLLQSSLLKLDWPPALLEHPKCRPRPLIPGTSTSVAPPGNADQQRPDSNDTSGMPSSSRLLVLFKGLSVRMGAATGVPAAVREHPVTKRLQYTGTPLRLATSIAGIGAGGMILLEPLTFKGIHSKLEELDVIEEEVQQLADLVNQDSDLLQPRQDFVPVGGGGHVAAAAGAAPAAGASLTAEANARREPRASGYGGALGGDASGGGGAAGFSMPGSASAMSSVLLPAELVANLQPFLDRVTQGHSHSHQHQTHGSLLGHGQAAPNLHLGPRTMRRASPQAQYGFAPFSGSSLMTQSRPAQLSNELLMLQHLLATSSSSNAGPLYSGRPMANRQLSLLHQQLSLLSGSLMGPGQGQYSEALRHQLSGLFATNHTGTGTGGAGPGSHRSGLSGYYAGAGGGGYTGDVSHGTASNTANTANNANPSAPLEGFLSNNPSYHGRHPAIISPEFVDLGMPCFARGSIPAPPSHLPALLNKTLSSVGVGLSSQANAVMHNSSMGLAGAASGDVGQLLRFMTLNPATMPRPGQQQQGPTGGGVTGHHDTSSYLPRVPEAASQEGLGMGGNNSSRQEGIQEGVVVGNNSPGMTNPNSPMAGGTHTAMDFHRPSAGDSLGVGMHGGYFQELEKPKVAAPLAPMAGTPRVGMSPFSAAFALPLAASTARTSLRDAPGSNSGGHSQPSAGAAGVSASTLMQDGGTAGGAGGASAGGGAGGHSNSQLDPMLTMGWSKQSSVVDVTAANFASLSPSQVLSMKPGSSAIDRGLALSDGQVGSSGLSGHIQQQQQHHHHHHHPAQAVGGSNHANTGSSNGTFAQRLGAHGGAPSRHGPGPVAEASIDGNGSAGEHGGDDDDPRLAQPPQPLPPLRTRPQLDSPPPPHAGPAAAPPPHALHLHDSSLLGHDATSGSLRSGSAMDASLSANMLMMRGTMDQSLSLTLPQLSAGLHPGSTSVLTPPGSTTGAGHKGTSAHSPLSMPTGPLGAAAPVQGPPAGWPPPSAPPAVAPVRQRTWGGPQQQQHHHRSASPPVRALEDDKRGSSGGAKDGQAQPQARGQGGPPQLPARGPGPWSAGQRKGLAGRPLSPQPAQLQYGSAGGRSFGRASHDPNQGADPAIQVVPYPGLPHTASGRARAPGGPQDAYPCAGSAPGSGLQAGTGGSQPPLVNLSSLWAPQEGYSAGYSMSMSRAAVHLAGGPADWQVLTLESAMGGSNDGALQNANSAARDALLLTQEQDDAAQRDSAQRGSWMRAAARSSASAGGAAGAGGNSASAVGRRLEELTPPVQWGGARSSTSGGRSDVRDRGASAGAAHVKKSDHRPPPLATTSQLHTPASDPVRSLQPALKPLASPFATAAAPIVHPSVADSGANALLPPAATLFPGGLPADAAQLHTTSRTHGQRSVLGAFRRSSMVDLLPRLRHAFTGGGASSQDMLSGHMGMYPVNSASFAVHRVVVLDMGTHRLEPVAPGAELGDVYHGVQVVAILPANLKARAAYQQRLMSVAQLGPSFFDAPGAAQALMPLSAGKLPDFPPVSLMFVMPDGLSAVAAASQVVADKCESVFSSTVRHVMQLYGCYECQEYGATFMMAAALPRVAAEAALALQAFLLGADWPADLLEMEQGRVVRSPDGRLLARGLRARVGIYTGAPLSIVPHTTTGRADYFGAVVNRAARLMAGARAGEILMDSVAGQEVLSSWRAAAQEVPSTPPLQQPLSPPVFPPQTLRVRMPGRQASPGRTIPGRMSASYSYSPVQQQQHQQQLQLAQLRPASALARSASLRSGLSQSTLSPARIVRSPTDGAMPNTSSPAGGAAMTAAAVTPRGLQLLSGVGPDSAQRTGTGSLGPVPPHSSIGSSVATGGRTLGEVETELPPAPPPSTAVAAAAAHAVQGPQADVLAQPPRAPAAAGAASLASSALPVRSAPSSGAHVRAVQPAPGAGAGTGAPPIGRDGRSHSLSHAEQVLAAAAVAAMAAHQAESQRRHEHQQPPASQGHAQTPHTAPSPLVRVPLYDASAGMPGTSLERVLAYDLGECQLKGLATLQSVMALRLRRLQLRPPSAPQAAPGADGVPAAAAAGQDADDVMSGAALSCGKAVLVKAGVGLLEEVGVRLLAPPRLELLMPPRASLV